MIKVQINEGQMNEGQREMTGRWSKIKTDLLLASAAEAGLHIFMIRFRSYLNKGYVTRVQSWARCVEVMLPLDVLNEQLSQN